MNGQPVANGTYTLCVEAAREHGPYSLVTGAVEVRSKEQGPELTRLLHSWLSMSSLPGVLFFALTGLTLNHQDWTFGQAPTVTTASMSAARGSDHGRSAQETLLL